jgi:hypothetical protein
MSTKIKPFEFWFLSPSFGESVAFGSIKYRPTPSSPFESGLEHFNVTFLLITSHIGICMTSSKVEPRYKAISDKINLKIQRHNAPKNKHLGRNNQKTKANKCQLHK